MEVAELELEDKRVSQEPLAVGVAVELEEEVRWLGGRKVS